MNELKDLIDRLDGYFTESTGFTVKFAKNDFDDCWSLAVKAYKREGNSVIIKNKGDLFTIAERLEQDGRWELLKVEALGAVDSRTYAIEVMKVKDEKETCEGKR